MDNKISNIVVASRIEDFQIVINKGEYDNIESYMRFLVYEEGNDVIDPTTKKSLGKLEIPKGFFKIQHIQDKMTILVSELRKEKSLFPFFNYLIMFRLGKIVYNGFWPPAVADSRTEFSPLKIKFLREK